jgi:hypothetical protein
MDSVPVWVLTAVIQSALLCSGVLVVLLGLTWRSRQRLMRRVQELQQALAGDPTAMMASAGTIPLPSLEPDSRAEQVEETPAAAALAGENEASPDALDEAVFTPLLTQEEAEPSTPGTADTVVAAAAAQPYTGAPEATEADEAPTGPLSQEMLVDLFKAVGAETAEGVVEAAAEEEGLQQNAAALLSASATMAEQIAGLQEKSQSLRQAVEVLQANAALPLAEQQDIPVPENLMREIETGLVTLQRTRDRMQGELEAHCQALGWDAETLAQLSQGEETASSEASGEAAARQKTRRALQQEIVHLQAEVAQRAADFERIKNEYDELLTEYERIFQQG